MTALLHVAGLRTAITSRTGTIYPADDVSLDVAVGETLALVGESGCGKSVTALSILRLLPRRIGSIVGGSIHLAGVDGDLVTLPDERMRHVRGGAIGMIFQEPMTSLNPLLTVGEQIAEPLRIHRRLSHRDAAREAVSVLTSVGMPAASDQARRYPHELSGGMRQRAMIAVAIACRPRLLIADEPTTALDVTIQAQVIALLRKLQDELGMGMLFITHNFALMAGLAHRMAVMYAGRIVEHGPVAEVFTRPRHPYTRGLLGCMPHLGQAHHLREHHQLLPTIAGTVPRLDALPSGCGFAPRCPLATDACRQADAAVCRCRRGPCRGALPALERAVSETLLHIAHLTKRFGGDRLLRRSPVVHAVEDVSLDVARGEVVGLVGESGSGKTTIARCALRLMEPTGGDISFAGSDLRTLTQRELKPFRRRMQYIFQDPFSSLSPRMTVGEIITEGLAIQGIGSRADRRARAAQVLAEVEMPEESLGRYPHQFSGGQRQRLGIARALALQPEFLVADEPVSALDVSIQAQIVKLLRSLQARRGLTMLFISHDLAVVEYLSDRVVVLYLGRVMEVAPTATLYATPHQPYTRALMAAVPIPDPGAPPRAALLHGDIPSPTSPPSGCVLHTRCPFATAECARIEPQLREITPGHFSACWRDDLPGSVARLSRYSTRISGILCLPGGNRGKCPGGDCQAGWPRQQPIHLRRRAPLLILK